MPPNFTTQNLTQQLNIGNIVTLGSYLYRSRFKFNQRNYPHAVLAIS
ncbi:hypothetical protein [Chlorogloeopsis fritschii]|nr:hypothetical protein [Chlorogloeopsis fritschii]